MERLIEFLLELRVRNKFELFFKRILVIKAALFSLKAVVDR